MANLYFFREARILLLSHHVSQFPGKFSLSEHLGAVSYEDGRQKWTHKCLISVDVFGQICQFTLVNVIFCVSVIRLLGFCPICDRKVFRDSNQSSARRPSYSVGRRISKLLVCFLTFLRCHFHEWLLEFCALWGKTRVLPFYLVNVYL